MVRVLTEINPQGNLTSSGNNVYGLRYVLKTVNRKISTGAYTLVQTINKILAFTHLLYNPYFDRLKAKATDMVIIVTSTKVKRKTKSKKI